MISLQQRICESLLDDEDDILDDNTIYNNSLLKDIFEKDIQNLYQGERELINIDKNGIHIKYMGNFWKHVFKNLFSGNIVKDIYSIESLSMHRNDFKEVSEKPIHINIINTFNIDDYFCANDNKNLNIDKINLCILVLHSQKDNWSHYIKKLNIDTLWVSGNYLTWTNKVEHPIEYIKKFNLDTLCLSCDMFPDKDVNLKRTQFILSEPNIKYLDELFENNNFKTLLVENQTHTSASIPNFKIIRKSESNYKINKSNKNDIYK